VYNHAVHEFNKIPKDERTLRQRVWQVRDELPDWRNGGTDLNKIYSTVLQNAVERLRTDINNLGKLETEGYDVGSLNWKSPRRSTHTMTSA
jgi:putative transposase